MKQCRICPMHKLSAREKSRLSPCICIKTLPAGAVNQRTMSVRSSVCQWIHTNQLFLSWPTTVPILWISSGNSDWRKWETQSITLNWSPRVAALAEAIKKKSILQLDTDTAVSQPVPERHKPKPVHTAFTSSSTWQPTTAHMTSHSQASHHIH